jgi:hypothetical protein
MQDFLPQLRLQRRPIRWSMGILSGLMIGPLIACVLANLPRNAWLSNDPCYRESLSAFSAAIGFGYGLAVGLGVTGGAKLIQRWKWHNGSALMPSLDLPVLESDSNLDARISPRPGKSKPPEEGITPAP